jgi:hypothetical protein
VQQKVGYRGGCHGEAYGSQKSGTRKDSKLVCHLAGDSVRFEGLCLDSRAQAMAIAGL